MKKTKEEIISFLDSCPQEDLKKMAFTFLRIKEHIWREFEQCGNEYEKRSRETMRLKIAQKHINNWYNEYIPNGN